MVELTKPVQKSLVLLLNDVWSCLWVAQDRRTRFTAISQVSRVLNLTLATGSFGVFAGLVSLCLPAANLDGTVSKSQLSLDGRNLVRQSGDWLRTWPRAHKPWALVAVRFQSENEHWVPFSEAEQGNFIC